MASFTAFKKRIAVGTELDVVNLRFPNASGRRVVTKAQGNGFFYEQKTGDLGNSGKRFWFEYLPASQVTMLGDDVCRMRIPGFEVADQNTYLVRIVQPGSRETCAGCGWSLEAETKTVNCHLGKDCRCGSLRASGAEAG